jgi:hypothetical protein
MCLGAFGEKEESGEGPPLAKGVENSRRHHWIRAIVEGERHQWLVAVNARGRTETP